MGILTSNNNYTPKEHDNEESLVDFNCSILWFFGADAEAFHLLPEQAKAQRGSWEANFSAARPRKRFGNHSDELPPFTALHSRFR